MTVSSEKVQGGSGSQRCSSRASRVRVSTSRPPRTNHPRRGRPASEAPARERPSGPSRAPPSSADRRGSVEAERTPEDGLRVRRTPKRASTAACTRRAKARTSRARAPSWQTMASVWRVERPTGPSRCPRVKPARSMSQAAESFTRPSGCGQRGIGEAGRARLDARRARPRPRSGSGRTSRSSARLGSSGSSTIDLERRMASTVSRTSASVGAHAACGQMLARDVGVAEVGAPPGTSR